MKNTLIRPIALCLFRREDRILVSTAYDSVKKDYFCRPLGGGIEFGERGAEAIVREIREELGAEIKEVRLLGTLDAPCNKKGFLQLVSFVVSVVTSGSLAGTESG